MPLGRKDQRTAINSYCMASLVGSRAMIHLIQSLKVEISLKLLIIWEVVVGFVRKNTKPELMEYRMSIVKKLRVLVNASGIELNGLACRLIFFCADWVSS